jgi:hypothetical protein
MILIPGYGKKHAAALVLAVAAVGGGVALSRGHVAMSPRSADAVPLAVSKPVTMDDYHAAVAAAAGKFVADDSASASAFLSALESIRVPREGMAVHEQLVIAAASYRAALAASNKASEEESLSRLRSFAEANPWCGLKP